MRRDVLRGFLKDLPCSLIDQCDMSKIVHRDHAFLDRLQHRLTLFKQGRDFVRLQPEQNPFEHFHQTIGAQRADHHAE
ncbi:hypothetical protein D3C80_1835330 [compost metagenome]